MGLLKTIRERHEERILAKAKRIEDEKAKQEQTKQAEIEQREQYIESILDLQIKKDYIVRLGRFIRDKKGWILYREYDYFLCETKKENLNYDCEMKVLKITGNNLGDKYTMRLNTKFNCIELKDRDRVLWAGYKNGEVYIPSNCTTIRDLKVYAKDYNNEQKEEFAEQLAGAKKSKKKAKSTTTQTIEGETTTDKK